MAREGGRTKGPKAKTRKNVYEPPTYPNFAGRDELAPAPAASGLPYTPAGINNPFYPSWWYNLFNNPPEYTNNWRNPLGVGETPTNAASGYSPLPGRITNAMNLVPGLGYNYNATYPYGAATPQQPVPQTAQPAGGQPTGWVTPTTGPGVGMGQYMTDVHGNVWWRSPSGQVFGSAMGSPATGGFNPNYWSRYSPVTGYHSGSYTGPTAPRGHGYATTTYGGYTLTGGVGRKLEGKPGKGAGPAFSTRWQYSAAQQAVNKKKQQTAVGSGPTPAWMSGLANLNI
jgi:hypothetical protein